MAKFTIGIPTFNRAGLLRTALKAALTQTHDEVEIIVSDNASTDNTAEVAREFGSRVRYFRNDTNLGASANFCRLVELATGEYFSWLQDDDCIFSQFAERAVAGLQRFPRATVYGAYAAVACTPDYLANSWLYGPPLALDWTSCAPRTFAGAMIAPLSLCASVAIPPVIAFRLPALKQCMPRWNHDIPLFVERTILADVASLGETVFEPYVAGVFRAHSRQGYRVIQAENPDANQQQWVTMARQLDAISGRRDGHWRKQLAATLLEVSEYHRQDWEQQSRTWPADVGLCCEMRDALTAKPTPPRVPLSPSGLARAGARAAQSLWSKVLS